MQNASLCILERHFVLTCVVGGFASCMAILQYYKKGLFEPYAVKIQ